MPQLRHQPRLLPRLLRMKRNSWLVPGLIVVGVVLILLSVWLPQNKLSFNLSQNHIATIIEKSGKVLLANNEMPAKADLKVKSKIHSGDRVRSTDSAEALIQFTSGAQIRLNPKTEVLLESQSEKQFLVVIKTGDISIEKFSEAPLWVRHNGQQYTAADYALLDKNNLRAGLPRITRDADLSDISHTEIEAVLNEKKTDFFKCFGQLLQRSPHASGQVMLSFTVSPLGSVTTPEVAKSEIADATFQACLLEVIARTRFRSFKGSPVTTVFPIHFE